jgi:hypothetical protein
MLKKRSRASGYSTLLFKPKQQHTSYSTYRLGVGESGGASDQGSKNGSLHFWGQESEKVRAQMAVIVGCVRISLLALLALAKERSAW